MGDNVSFSTEFRLSCNVGDGDLGGKSVDGKSMKRKRDDDSDDCNIIGVSKKTVDSETAVKDDPEKIKKPYPKKKVPKKIRINENAKHQFFDTHFSKSTNSKSTSSKKNTESVVHSG